MEDRWDCSRREGHVLIVPKRHIAGLLDARAEEMAAIYELIVAARDALDQRFKPDGYNIGANVGEATGQTVFHLHVHIIPRYIGEVDNPQGGIRKIKRSIVSVSGAR